MTATRWFLFQDDREEGLPYCLFVDGLEPDEDEDEEQETKTLEVRLRDIWEFIEIMPTIKAEFGAFEVTLGEPDHYSEVVGEMNREILASKERKEGQSATPG